MYDYNQNAAGQFSSAFNQAGMRGNVSMPGNRPQIDPGWNRTPPLQPDRPNYADYYNGMQQPRPTRPVSTPYQGYGNYVGAGVGGAPQSQPFFTGVNPAYTEYIKQFSPEEQRKRKIKELMDAQAMFQSQAPASPYGMTSTYNPPQYLRMG